MAASSNPVKITATATGASDYINLPPGEHTLVITGGGTYAGTLQTGLNDGTGMDDAYIAGSAADFADTGNNSFVVPGGCYQLQVDTYGSSAITCTVVSSRH